MTTPATILADCATELSARMVRIEEATAADHSTGALVRALSALTYASQEIARARGALIRGETFDPHDGEVKENALRQACEDAERS